MNGFKNVEDWLEHARRVAESASFDRWSMCFDLKLPLFGGETILGINP
jgi:hypothetical protein